MEMEESRNRKRKSGGILKKKRPEDLRPEEKRYGIGTKIDPPPYRFVVPDDDPVPSRPPGITTSTALEIVQVEKVREGSCQEGIASFLWHSRSDRVKADAGKCVRGITFIADKPRKIPMIVADRQGVGCYHYPYHNQPSKYQLDLSLKPGINHFLYCITSRIQMLDQWEGEKSVKDLPHSRRGPTIYFPWEKNVSHSHYRYQEENDTYVKYGKMMSRNREEHEQPRINIMDDEHLRMGVLRNVTLVSDNDSPLSLILQAKLSGGTRGLQNSELVLPFDDVFYNQINYKLYPHIPLLPVCIICQVHKAAMEWKPSYSSDSDSSDESE